MKIFSAILVAGVLAASLSPASARNYSPNVDLVPIEQVLATKPVVEGRQSAPVVTPDRVGPGLSEVERAIIDRTQIDHR